MGGCSVVTALLLIGISFAWTGSLMVALPPLSGARLVLACWPCHLQPSLLFSTIGVGYCRCSVVVSNQSGCGCLTHQHGSLLHKEGYGITHKRTAGKLTVLFCTVFTVLVS
jgi:hypothetical protein